MNWHYFERLSNQIGITGLASIATVLGFGVEEGTVEVAEKVLNIPPEVYIVGWMGVVTLLIIRFVLKFGKHVPRTPNGELSRYKEAQDKKYDALHAKVDKACEDMATIKRDYALLVVTEGEGALP